VRVLPCEYEHGLVGCAGFGDEPMLVLLRDAKHVMRTRIRELSVETEFGAHELCLSRFENRV
jgi:hypothetical protein